MPPWSNPDEKPGGGNGGGGGGGGGNGGSVSAFNVIDGSNVIKGTKDTDWIYGSPGDDDIDARQGDDLIVPGTGNDVINGGAGEDVVIYDFSLTVVDEYTLGNTTYFIYEHDGTEYTDQYTNVEYVIYGETVAAEDTGPWTIDFDTGYGIYEAETSPASLETDGTSDVMLTSGGTYVIATSGTYWGLDADGFGTVLLSGGTEDIDDAAVLVESGVDGDPDFEFVVSSGASAGGIYTSHEVNVQSAFNLLFDVESFDVEGFDSGEKMKISYVDSGGNLQTYAIVGYDDFSGGTYSLGTDIQNVDQFIIEAAEGDSFYIDNIVIA